MTVIEALANDAISIFEHFCSKKETRTKLGEISDNVMERFIGRLKPYFFLLIGLLIAAIVMNCIQFYYYIKVYLHQFDASDKLKAAIKVLE